MRSFSVIIIGGFLWGSLPNLFAGENVISMVSVQGHRGARGVRPENTLSAFRFALEKGVEIIELDLGITKDLIPIVAHDPLLNPVICRARDGKPLAANLPLFSLTLAEAQALDCGSQKNPRFPQQVPVPGEKMPSLAEVFDWLNSETNEAAKKVELNIEIKFVPAGVGQIHPTADVFVKSVLRVIQEKGFSERVMIQSFDHSVLRAVRKQDPKMRISALFAENAVDYLAIARMLKANFISPNHHWITRPEVQALQKSGIGVAVWTVNEERDWQRMLELGVDSIITDYPEELARYLTTRKIPRGMALGRRKQRSKPRRAVPAARALGKRKSPRRQKRKGE